MHLLLLRAKSVSGGSVGHLSMLVRCPGCPGGAVWSKPAPCVLPRGHQGQALGGIEAPGHKMLPPRRGASLELRAHVAVVVRAQPEASSFTRSRKSPRAPDGDAEVFPASFLLSAVALAFCTTGPKCVFHRARAQRWMGRGCSRVLLGSLALSPLFKLARFGTGL